jgi:hypothetical protein
LLPHEAARVPAKHKPPVSPPQLQHFRKWM